MLHESRIEVDIFNAPDAEVKQESPKGSIGDQDSSCIQGVTEGVSALTTSDGR